MRLKLRLFFSKLTVTPTSNNNLSQMKLISSFLISFTLLSAVQTSLAQEERYSNIFTEQLGPIKWQVIADSVAPNVPEYLFSHSEVNDEYKEVVVQWIYDFPEEIDKAKMLDFRLHEYINWAINPNNEPKGGNSYGNPPFVYFPVNQYKPVFLSTNNTDQDSLVFRNKLQNWYLQNDPDVYQTIYGDLPALIPYPKLISHPNQIPSSQRDTYEMYFPEFSEDEAVFEQYLVLYAAQYGGQPNLETR